MHKAGTRTPHRSSLSLHIIFTPYPIKAFQNSLTFLVLCNFYLHIMLSPLATSLLGELVHFESEIVQAIIVLLLL